MKKNNQRLLITGLALASTGFTHADNSIQDVPISVTAMNNRQFTSDATLRSNLLQDLTQNVPSAATFTSNGTTNINLRGVGTGTAPADPNLGHVPTGLYIPGLQRVEVLRGPQGTLFGKNASTGAITVQASVGYHGNVTYEPVNGYSSEYISAGIGYEQKFDYGDSSLSVAASLNYVHYDEKIENRDGNDQTLHDLAFNLYYNNQISDSTELDINLGVNYGDHGTIPRGFNWPGALSHSVIDYSAEALLTWRADGKSLVDAGFIFRTGVNISGFDESDSDNFDSQKYGITQEVIYQLNEDSGYYARIGYAQREFDVMSDYDSTYCDIIAGFFVPVPCGSRLRLGVGAESIDYDNSSFDDRSDGIAELLLDGNIGRGRFSLGARYGTVRNFVNWGNVNGLDMMGLQLGARVVHPINERTNIRFAFESSSLDAAAADFADGGLDFQRGSVGIGYQINDDTTLDVVTGLNRVSVDNGGNSNSDSFSTFNIAIRRTW